MMTMTTQTPALPRIQANYRQLFDGYIEAALRQMLATVQAAPHQLADEVVTQAWHLLSYGTALDSLWPLVRDLLLALAPKLEMAGYRSEWMAYLQSGLHQAERCQDVVANAQIRLQMGILYRLQSQFDEALEQLAQSRVLFMSQGHPGQSAALNQIAWIRYLQHDYHASRLAAEQALSLLDLADPERGMSYRVLGMLAINHGQYEEARLLHEQALHYFERAEQARYAAWSLQNVGYALSCQHRYQKAIPYYETALQQLRELNDHYHWAIVRMNLGIVYNESGVLQAAHDCYWEAVAVFSRLQERLFLAKVHNNLGVNYLDAGDLPNAEQAFQTSLALYQGLNDIPASADVAGELAMIYLAQTRAGEAVALLEQALQQLATLPDLPQRDEVTIRLQTRLATAQQQQQVASS